MMEVIPKETSLSGTSSDSAIAPQGFDIFTIGASGLEGSIALPRTRSSTIVTSMMLDAGQTAVIGGLTSDQDVKVHSKIRAGRHPGAGLLLQPRREHARAPQPDRLHHADDRAHARGPGVAAAAGAAARRIALKDSRALYATRPRRRGDPRPPASDRGRDGPSRACAAGGRLSIHVFPGARAPAGPVARAACVSAALLKAVGRIGATRQGRTRVRRIAPSIQDTPMTSEPNGTAGRRPRLSIAQMLGVIRVEFHRARTQRYPLCCLMIAVDGLEAVRARRLAGEGGLDAARVRPAQARRARARFIGMAVQSGDRIMAVVPEHTDRARHWARARALARRRSRTHARPRALELAGRVAQPAGRDELVVRGSRRERRTRAAPRDASGGARYVMWREAESEIDALRATSRGGQQSFRRAAQRSRTKRRRSGGLQRAELVDKIQRIFATGHAHERDREPREAGRRPGRRRALRGTPQGRRRQMREHGRQVDMLERRIAKLTSLLGVTEEELARVMAMKQIDAGVASIFKTVAGTARRRPAASRPRRP
jgi:hypothetical protein